MCQKTLPIKIQSTVELVPQQSWIIIIIIILPTLVYQI